MPTIVNPFKPLINKIPSIFRNRYYLVLGLFLFWMVFFDRHDVLTQIRLSNALEGLEEDRILYQKQIEQAKQDRKDIIQNKEKFAREHYYMRQPDEEIFVITPKE